MKEITKAMSTHVVANIRACVCYLSVITGVLDQEVRKGIVMSKIQARPCDHVCSLPGSRARRAFGECLKIPTCCAFTHVGLPHYCGGFQLLGETSLTECERGCAQMHTK